MNKIEREAYFLALEDELLLGGASFSEWCTFISKSVYDAFVNEADIATVITATTCIETYFKAESPENRKKSLAQLIDDATGLSDEEKSQLHRLRQYRNAWVHADRIDDTELLKDESSYAKEVEEMAILSIRLLLTVLFSNPFI
ncbi:hypothetical protein [Intestinimonas butyriciproducens]|uniref:hypothetical protein n=1 Tax=Intestinimonas butyriciproducens TaxID=1297617 RepID=UPI00189AE1B0|nr:hypothetical protein [Intestinimonas butyriciproducens]MDB7831615.1 hypothetical protein [Intestinimonas butyriciproducens]